MGLIRRGFRLSAGLVVLVLAMPAIAQENLEHGKSPAQQFATDCAVCHKSPQGLTKSGGLFGLDSFLREHYTTSRKSAARMSAYLKSIASGSEAPAKRARRDGDGKGSERPKATAKKPAEAKADGSKPSEAKPSEVKPSEVKPSEVKPAESKPAEVKPAEAKPSETKTEAKPEPKPESKPAEAKPDNKPAETKPDSAAKPGKAD